MANYRQPLRSLAGKTPPFLKHPGNKDDPQLSGGVKLPRNGVVGASHLGPVRMVGNSERGLRDGGRPTLAIPGEKSPFNYQTPKKSASGKV
jgi:hypothetical protein